MSPGGEDRGSTLDGVKDTDIRVKGALILRDEPR
jgi:hypothetical protein